MSDFLLLALLFEARAHLDLDSTISLVTVLIIISLLYSLLIQRL